MGLFDFLQAKPKRCQSCQKECPKLHEYNSIYFEGKETRQSPLLMPRLLCNDCFLSQEIEDLSNFKDKIVFSEPILREGYSFRKFADDEVNGIGVDSTPLKSFLPENNSACNKCGQSARFTWVPKGAVKESRSADDPLQFITREECSEYKYLCAKHLIEEFSESLRVRKIFFTDFWPVKGSGNGYCW